MAHQAVIDTQTGAILWQEDGPVHVTETSLIERAETWWSTDSRRVFFVDHDRYEQRISLVEMDRETGTTREIIEETSDHFVDVNMEYGRRPNIRVLDAINEAIWFSQRDGWAHLYLIDLAGGNIMTQITTGAWVVRDILAVDETAREVFFLAGGFGENQTPYRRSLCRADLDKGAVAMLTPDRGDTDVAMQSVGWADIVEREAMIGPQASAISPDCALFVHTHAPANSLPVSSLRRRGRCSITPTPGVQVLRQQAARITTPQTIPVGQMGSGVLCFWGMVIWTTMCILPKPSALPMR